MDNMRSDHFLARCAVTGHPHILVLVEDDKPRLSPPQGINFKHRKVIVKQCEVEIAMW